MGKDSFILMLKQIISSLNFKAFLHLTVPSTKYSCSNIFTTSASMYEFHTNQVELNSRQSGKSKEGETGHLWRSDGVILEVSVNVGCRRVRGQSQERVQVPEAVSQSAGPEEAFWWVGGIPNNAQGFGGEPGIGDVMEAGGERHRRCLSCSHDALEGLVAGHSAGAVPHSDAAAQEDVHCTSVEGGHDDGLLSFWRKQERCCAF